MPHVDPLNQANRLPQASNQVTDDSTKKVAGATPPDNPLQQIIDDLSAGKPLDTAGEVQRVGSTVPPQLVIASKERLFANRYRIVDEIGRGGMGVVFRAIDTQADNREVALKLILQAQAGQVDEKSILRFTRETQAMDRLHHRNIPPIYDFGRDGTINYYVTRLIEGGSLSKPASSLSLTQRLLIVADICDALQYAHQNGILHRDVKPGNIMLDKEPTNHDLLLPDGKILNWNPPSERLYGYTPSEATNRDVSFLSPAKKSDEMARLLERVLKGERIANFDTQRVHKDGGLLQVLLNFSPRKDDGGTVICVSSSGTVYEGEKPHHLIDTLDDVPRPTPFLVDFGLVKIPDATYSVTSTGDSLGSPAYVSPEQATGRKDLLGPLSDLYSIGAILYEVVTGELPVPSDAGAWAALIGQLSVRPKTFGELDIKTIPGLEPIILALLEKTPQSRHYKSAGEVASALRNVVRNTLFPSKEPRKRLPPPP